MREYGALEPSRVTRRERGRLVPGLIGASCGLLAVVAVVAMSRGENRGIALLDYWPGISRSQVIPTTSLVRRSLIPESQGSKPKDYYWPGIPFDEVRPDVDAERSPFEKPNWIGNGYGIYIHRGRAGIHKGFFGPCKATKDCANMDICFSGRCMPAIRNGTAALCERMLGKGNPKCGNSTNAIEAGAGASAGGGAATPVVTKQSSRQQQLMVNMAYQHHEFNSPGGAGAHYDDGTLPVVPREVVQHVVAKQQTTPSMWRDPVSGEWGNDHAVKGSFAMRGGVRAARVESLADGGGTPVDLTFGIGADGEAPMHLKTTAESIHNGALDPNAPEVLPYASITGSGTQGHVESVGYMTS
uniref:Uncharacterized protein n=2 Tax=Hemiselmis andersenii TaxID=464988 RepID=A0A7S0Y3F2_HEMAN